MAEGSVKCSRPTAGRFRSEPCPSYQATPHQGRSHLSVRAHRAHASASHADGRLPAVARIYLLLLGATTVGLVVPLLARIGPDTNGWSAFAVVALGAAAGHVFSVSGPRNQSFDAGSLFLLAGALLLPLELVALLGVTELALAWLMTSVW